MTRNGGGFRRSAPFGVPDRKQRWSVTLASMSAGNIIPVVRTGKATSGVAQQYVQSHNL